MVIFSLAPVLAGALFAAGLEDGVALMKAERYQDAVRVLEHEAKAHPGSADVLINLGWAYQGARRPDDARRCYDLLVRLDPRNPTYLRLLADMEAQRRHYDAAMKLSRRALAIAPGDKDAALTYARLLLGQSRLEEGGAIIEKLRQRFPEDHAVEFAMADYLSETGRLDDALNYLDRLIRDEPSNVSVRRLRASVLYRLGYTKQAVAEWETLASQRPPDEKALINLGWAAWHDQRIDEAQVYGAKLVELDPGNPAYLRFLGHIKLELKESADALKLGLAALKKMPNDRDTLVLVAKALFHLRRDAEAMRIMRGLMADHPGDERLSYQMADFLVALDRPEEALVFLDALVKDHPDNVVYRKRRALVNYGLGNFDAAINEWKRLNEKNPNDSEPIDHLLDDAYARGAWDEAIYWIRQLAGTRSLDSMGWLKLSRIYRQLGHLPQSLETAEKAYETDPTFIAGLYQKAEVLEEMQDWPKAREAWSQLLTKSPQSPRAMFALARVAEGEGDLARAVKVVRAVKQQYFSEKTCPAYIELYEARLLADMGKYQESLRVLKRAEHKNPAVPVILYHGLSNFERGESLWKDNFRKQMLAIKNSGYNPITAVELEKFLEGKGRLPDKPILITFDDGRADSFKYADPILAETGLKATMFVITNSFARNPWNASVEDVRYWRGTGRWELQLHADRSHVFAPVDRAGHKGHFLANRLWLPEQNRLETIEEAEKRLDEDYRSGKEKIERLFPGSDVIAFAFPFGDYGQADYTNDPRIAEINTRLMEKHFKMAFVQDQYGYNFVGSKMHELSRFEVMRETTDKQLMRALQLGKPWVRARLLEAQVWQRAGQPARAVPIYEDVAAHGVDQPELYADWGEALERTGEPYQARRMLAKALDEDPGNAHYQMLLDQSRHNSQPRISFGADGWHDNAARSVFHGLGHATASAGPLDLDAYAGHGRYAENGFSAVDSNEGGGASTLHVGSKLDLKGQLTRRRFNLGSRKASDDYTAGAGVSLWKGVRAEGSFGEDDVETAAAITHGRRYHIGQGSLAWDPALNWTLGGSYANLAFNDFNREWTARANLTRKLDQFWSLGYALWLGDSRFEPTDYWTPRKLSEHLAVVAYNKPFGAIMESNGLPRAQLRLQYGAGYGKQESSARFVQNARAGLQWRLSDLLFFNGDAEYLMTAGYRLSQLSAGIGLTY